MSPYVIVACCLLTGVTSSRFLLVPFDHKGNLNFLLVLGQELHERGHDVDVLVPKHSEALVTSYGLHPLVAPYTVDTDNVLGEGVFKAGGGGLELVWKSRKMVNITVTQLRELFADDVFVQRLKAKNYDLILIDGYDFARALLVIPHYLDVKFIAINARNDPWMARVPSLPVEGMVPVAYMDENSGIVDRLKTLFGRVMTYLFLSSPTPLLGISDDLIAELVPEKPNPGFAALYR